MHAHNSRLPRSPGLAVFIALGVSLLVGMPGGPALAQQPPVAVETLTGRTIKKVEILGNVRTDARMILEQVRAQAGQVYNRHSVDIDVRSIASLERFITVRADVIPTDDGMVIIRYIVEERPVVTSVEVVGSRQFKDEQIREVLTVRAGSGIDPFAIETDKKSILDMYRKKGFAVTNVEVDKDLLKQGVVRYKITEGPKSLITKIEFNGNTGVKSSLLKWKISTKTNFWFFRKGIIDDDKLQADLVTIREQYLKRGYLDARVSYSLEFSEDKRSVTVRFVINEGPRYTIRSLVLKGNEVFPTGELLAGNKFGPGAFAERDKMDALQRRIEDKYGHEGYIYRNVELVPAYTDTPGVVDLIVTITEGKPYIIGRIIVRGNPNIQDRVIRRQMRVYPDQTYDLVLVKKSQDRLKAVRIFQDVTVTPIGDAPDSRDMLVQVAEGQTGRFMVGAGVSSNAGVVGQVSLEQQNFDIMNPPQSMGEFLRGQSFKGAGQFFRILLEPGTEFQRYRITFEEPYLFDSQYSFGNDLYFFTRTRESWNERRIGDIVTFGRRFGDIWSANVALRAEQVSILNPQDYLDNGITDTIVPAGVSQDTAQEILNAKGTHFLTSIKPAIGRDTTDSHTFPTEGTRLVISWEEYGAIGGEVKMSKVSGHFDWYYTLYNDLFDRKTVFRLSNEISAIVDGKSPFYERFYAGGIGSLRGFKLRGVSPRSGPLKDPIGGDMLWTTTAEVNFPIYENAVRGVVFVDVGDVEPTLTIEKIRADAGVGIRLTLPFFGQLPLAVDVAFPFLKQAEDETQLISFSLGIPF